MLATALISFACVVFLVVIISLAVAPRGYKLGNSPEAVAYNYIFSLVNKDFSKAFGLLSKDLGDPPESVSAFVDDLEKSELLPYDEIQPCVYIENIDIQDKRILVSLRMQYYDPCWRLDVGTTNLSFNSITITLDEQEDGWKVIDGSDFFKRGWIEVEG